MTYLTGDSDQAVTVEGWDRAEIEAKFRGLAGQALSAEVFGKDNVVVARKVPNEPGLHRLPGALGWGHVCVNCWTLAGQGRLEPAHANLRKLESRRHRGGMASGVVTEYSCAECATVLQLDNDRKDPGSGWTFHVWPTWLPGAV
jgi:hypothetical protein